MTTDLSTIYTGAEEAARSEVTDCVGGAGAEQLLVAGQRGGGQDVGAAAGPVLAPRVRQAHVRRVQLPTGIQHTRA